MLKGSIKRIFKTDPGRRVFKMAARELKKECTDVLLENDQARFELLRKISHEFRKEYVDVLLGNEQTRRIAHKFFAREMKKNGDPRDPRNKETHRLIERFSDPQVPEKIEGFEDLYFLFSCSKKNRGIIRMDFDEATYLFKLVKSLEDPFCVEIGRYRGGSTLLIASAMARGALLSLEAHVGLGEEGERCDAELSIFLSKLSLREKVHLLVADSGSYDHDGLTCNFLFIDGDHRYEGVKKDFEHWQDVLTRGGHVLFHDDHGRQPGVQRFIKELSGNPSLRKIEAAGTLAHFIKL